MGIGRLPILCDVEVAQAHFVIAHRITVHKSDFEVIGLRVEAEGFVKCDILSAILNDPGLLGLISQLQYYVGVLP